MFRENKPLHLSPYDHPDIYPGPRPNRSFLYYKGQAHSIEVSEQNYYGESNVYISEVDHILGSVAFPSSTKQTIDEFLKKQNLVPMAQRVPVVGYGSNVCLAQLKYKFSLTPHINDIMICLRGEMIDSDIVYGSFLAPYGALPAVIAPVQQAKTEVWITFIDKEQLDLMNSTEGGYELRVHDAGKIKLEHLGEITHPVYAYYYPHALRIDGELVRFNDIPGTSSLKPMWQADMIDKIKMLFKFGGTREQFIHNLRWNHVFRKNINQFLTEFDYEFNHPDWFRPVRISTLEEI